MVREVDVALVQQAVAELCQSANFHLGDDVVRALERSKEREMGHIGERVLDTILLNVNLASTESRPMCQDTGTAVVFVEVGQDVHFVGGLLDDAINGGIRQGYREGYLRNSVVGDPLWTRENTGDNTPAMIHVEFALGSDVKVTVMTKGGGAENMSRMAMLTPAMGVEGVTKFVVETVEIAGPNACPPVIVGVGVGGTFDMAPMLAKKALLRPVGQPSPDKKISQFEQKLLDAVNDLGIGPHGFGGFTTALAVHVETTATHIASLPVAVNLQCGPAARHRSRII